MSTNPVCPKFISNKRVFRKIGVRIFEFLPTSFGLQVQLDTCTWMLKEFINANVIKRDYYMAFFISYPESTRDTHICPRAKSDMGVSGHQTLYHIRFKL